MAEYEVQVARRTYQYVTLTVEADTPAAAKTRAEWDAAYGSAFEGAAEDDVEIEAVSVDKVHNPEEPE